jgi:hypothetical protein
MAKIKANMGEYVKEVTCICNKSDTLFYAGHDGTTKIIECHNCFARFDNVKELTTEGIIEAMKEKNTFKSDNLVVKDKGKTSKKDSTNNQKDAIAS